MVDLEKFVDGLHDYIARALRPLASRLEKIESRQAEKGERGADGRDGRDGVDGKDGRDGIDGKDGQPGPAGIDGKDGRDGIDGKDGVHGKDGEIGPAGRDGKDGIDGKAVTVDDIRPIIEAEIAKAVLDIERRAQDVVQRAVERIPDPKDGKDGRDGRDGVDGKDGRDALSVDDFDLSMSEDFRTLTVALKCGDIIVNKSVDVPALQYRSYYKDGNDYRRGDCVTFAGCVWVAMKDGPSGKPKDGLSTDWMLAVKAGRDGKDGRNGIDLTAPVKVT